MSTHLDDLFESEQTARFGRALRRLLAHNLKNVALTGSIAVAAHLGSKPGRTFGDIDLVVESVDGLPPTIAEEFICPHVHPAAAPGRLMLQLVNPGDSVRIDVFKTRGSVLSRAKASVLDHRSVPILTLEDMAARAVSLLLKLGRGGTMAAKHAEDFSRLAEALYANAAQIAWQDHRAATDPESFAEAALLARRYIAERPHLLVDPVFANDPSVRCENCAPLAHFRPAPRDLVLAILGYV